jgi:hypothetical protein
LKEQNIMTIVEASEPFRSLSEEAILEALADPAHNNTVALEVARLISGYTENFKRHVEQLGYFPSQVLRSKGSCPIEEVAMKLVTETICNTVAGAKK